MWIIFLMEGLDFVRYLKKNEVDFCTTFTCSSIYIEKYLYQTDESLIWHTNISQYIEIICYKNVI